MHQTIQNKNQRHVPVLLFEGDPRRQKNSSSPLSSSPAPLRPCVNAFLQDDESSDSDDDQEIVDESGVFTAINQFGARRRRLSRTLGNLNSTDVAVYRQFDQANVEAPQNCHLRIPVNFLKDCAEMFDQRLRFWSELALFVPFLLLFVFFVIIGSNITDLYYAGVACKAPSTIPVSAVDSLRGPTWGRTMETSISLEDVSDWLERVVVPTYWSNESMQTNENAFRLVLGNQIPLGALVIRIQRRADVVPVTSCVNVSALSTICSVNLAENIGVQSKLGQGATVATDAYGNLSFQPRYSRVSYTSAHAGSYDWGGNTLVIPFSSSRATALASMQSLRANADAGWFGIRHPALQSVSVVAITFNPSLLYYFRTEFLFESPSSGVVYPSTTFLPFFLFTTEGNGGFSAYTVIYFVICSLMGFRWIVSLLLAALHRRFSAHLASIWLYVEAANLAVLFIVFVIRFLWWQQSDGVISMVSVGTAATQSTSEDLLNSHNRMEYIAALYRLQNQLNAVNAVLFFMLILKYSSIHPNIARVTNAMRRAQENMIGLLAIFVSVLLAYAVGGNALYGGELRSFRSISTTFSTLMRTLLGDSDYDNMETVNMLLTGVYYWSFMTLELFITLNFIMAIVSEALSEDSNCGASYVPLKRQYVHAVNSFTRYVVRLGIGLRESWVQFRNPRVNENEPTANASLSDPDDESSAQHTSLRVKIGRMFRRLLFLVVDALKASVMGAVWTVQGPPRGSYLGSFGSGNRYTDIANALDAQFESAAERVQLRMGRMLNSGLGDFQDAEAAADANAMESHVSSNPVKGLLVCGTAATVNFVEFLAAMAASKSNDDDKSSNSDLLSPAPKADSGVHEPSTEQQHESNAMATPNQSDVAATRVRERLSRRMEVEYFEALSEFWDSAQRQYCHRMNSKSVVYEEQLRKAAWITAKRSVRKALEVSIAEADEPLSSKSYPVLDSAIRSVSETIQMLNRTVDLTVSTSVEVQRLSQLLMGLGGSGATTNSDPVGHEEE